MSAVDPVRVARLRRRREQPGGACCHMPMPFALARAGRRWRCGSISGPCSLHVSVGQEPDRSAGIPPYMRIPPPPSSTSAWWSRAGMSAMRCQPLRSPSQLSSTTCHEAPAFLDPPAMTAFPRPDASSTSIDSTGRSLLRRRLPPRAAPTPHFVPIAVLRIASATHEHHSLQPCVVEANRMIG